MPVDCSTNENSKGDQSSVVAGRPAGLCETAVDSKAMRETGYTIFVTVIHMLYPVTQTLYPGSCYTSVRHCTVSNYYTVSCAVCRHCATQTSKKAARIQQQSSLKLPLNYWNYKHACLPYTVNKVS